MRPFGWSAELTNDGRASCVRVAWLTPSRRVTLPARVPGYGALFKLRGFFRIKTYKNKKGLPEGKPSIFGARSWTRTNDPLINRQRAYGLISVG